MIKIRTKKELDAKYRELYVDCELAKKSGNDLREVYLNGQLRALDLVIESYK